MVSERDRVRAGGQDPVGEPRGDPDAVRRVLAVDDAEVDLELVPKAREQALDRVASGATDDVADEEDPHGARLGNEARRGIHRDRDVVAVVGGVLRERLLLDRGDVDDGPELGDAQR